MTRSLAVAVLLVALCAAGASAASKPGFYGCRGFVSKHPVSIVRPTSIVVACGDGNQYLTGIRWSAWTATSAKGIGTVHFNDCTPNCAAGRFHTARASVSLSRPAICKGSRVFTTLSAVWKSNTALQRFYCQ